MPQMAETQLSVLHGPKSTPNWRLFQNLQILSPSLPGMTSFTLQPHFLLGFIMTIVIVISSAHERKLYPMCVHLN